MHWIAAKHVLLYLTGTLDYGLDYRRSDGVGLIGFTDLDWAGSASDWKSTSGCCFSLGKMYSFLHLTPLAHESDGPSDP